MSRQFIIGNPPAGIYKGDLHIGYAFYHVILDVYARYLRESERLEIAGPRFSLNAFGKRADKISSKEDPEKFRDELGIWVKDWISNNRLRDRLNLSLDGLLIDNCSESIAESQKAFLRLNDQGYLIRASKTFFLDTQKIARERDLSNAAKEVCFYPVRTRGEFTRMLIENTRMPIAITKPTRYSATNPIGGENLGPLFVLSTLWETKYPNGIDLLATSDKELARYTLLRFLVRMATHRDPLTKTVLTYNRIDPEGSFEDWDIAQLTTDPFKTDMLRYALVKSHSVSEQRTALSKSFLLGGRNFVYLIGNLKKFFLLHGQVPISEHPYEDETEKYKSKMKEFRFNDALSDLEVQLRGLSKKIRAARDSNRLGDDLPQSYKEYLFCLSKVSPFCPAIVDSVKNDLGVR